MLRWIKRKWFPWWHKHDYEELGNLDTRTKITYCGIDSTWYCVSSLERCVTCGQERLVSAAKGTSVSRIRRGKAVERFKVHLWRKKQILVFPWWDYSQFTKQELEDDQKEESSNA